MRPRKFHFTRFFSPDVGIDLGTSHTRISLPSEGIVLDEPSIVAVVQGSRRVLGRNQAVGHLAGAMYGRIPDSVQIIRPVRDGVVADIEVCATMLRAFLQKAIPRIWGMRPRALVAVPSGITQVERQAVLTTTLRAGARQVFLINKSQAAALGAGLPLNHPVASMICDFGSGNTEIAVLCLGDVPVRESMRVASEELNYSISDFLRRKHRLCVGEQMAERIKLDVGSAIKLDLQLGTEIGGRDLVSGMPRKMVLTGEQVREAIEDSLQSIVNGVERVLERCPPELAADLMENGMVLAGGGSLLRGLDQRLATVSRMPVRVAENSTTCVARGLAICLEHLDVWQGLIQNRMAA